MGFLSRSAVVLLGTAACAASLQGETVLYDFEDAAVRTTLPRVDENGFSAGCVEGHAVGGLWSYALRTEPGDERPHLVSLDIPPGVTFNNGDRLVIDVLTLGESDTATLHVFLPCVPKGKKPHGGHNYIQPAGGSFERIEFNLSHRRQPATRILFELSHGNGAEVYVDNITLYRAGETIPPPAPMYAAMKASAGKLSAERAAAREREAHAPAVRRFAADCAAAGQSSSDFLIGEATAMEKVLPRGADAPRALDLRKGVAVRLARCETEAVQLFVSPRGRDLKNVGVTALPLVREGGTETFSPTQVECRVVGYVQILHVAPYPVAKSEPTNAPPGYVTKGRTPELGWWPDPILDYLTQTDVADGDFQGFWVRVKCPEGQRAGVYRGALRVSADGAMPVDIPLSVRVNGFSVPKESPLPLAITFSPGPTTQHEGAAGLARAARLKADPAAPCNLWKRQKAAWGRMLADNYVTMDNLYFQTGAEGAFPVFDVLQRLKAEGRLGWFNLGYWNQPKDLSDKTKERWKKETLGRLRENYERAKALGLLDRAYIYGCDEAPKEELPQIAWAVGELKAAFPGVPISTTAYDHEFGVGTPLSCMDWFTPLTPMWNAEKVAASRRAGHQVWWYVCCGPHAPYANLFIETGIDIRILMGAQAAKFRPDGFLYYQTSIWNSERPIEGTSAFTTWEPRSWTTYHGDGSLTCCGPDGMPLPTVRLENLRDGLEDYAYALELERLVEEAPSAPWADEARRLVAVPDEVTSRLDSFTGDPRTVLRWRDRMADLIEAKMKGMHP